MSWLGDWRHKILNAIPDAASFVTERLGTLISGLMSLPTWCWRAVSFVSSGVVVAWSLTKQAAETFSALWASMMEVLDQLGVGNWAFAAGSAAPWFAKINTFFPLQEAFSMLGTYLALYVLVLKVKAIKWIIPGL